MKEKLKLRSRVKYEFKDDPLLYEQLMKIILAAQEIASLSPEDSKKYQKNIF